MAFAGVLPIVFLLILSSADLAASQSQPGPTNQPYNYGRLSPAMAVIVVILIAALFFMGFFSIYFRHCSGVPDAGVSPAGGAIQSNRQRGGAWSRRFSCRDFSYVLVLRCENAEAW
jgi:E3 ubiquitin-protein ligase ATL6/9/15/31/42/55